ncbi:Tetratricopeptide-like helical domain-containing protein [Dioscorea alata]|uniref:Tetratricopeptide-like helical domain-containing protein n=1 Tax=Dioscorea alata TaxID=55571 RepID=A0ACB7TUV1_DIOAL|nr:Tetratricopeptide-like helical domain-containing protein [Dioscorea alata]
MEVSMSLPQLNQSASPHHHFTATRKRRRSNAINQYTGFKNQTLTSQPYTCPSSSSPMYEELMNLTSLASLKQAHCRILKSVEASQCDWLLMNKMLQLYSEFGDFQSAAMVFLIGLQHEALSWTDLIEKFRNEDNPSKLLEVLGELHGMGVVFTARVLITALKISSKLEDLFLGLQMLTFVIKLGFDSDPYAMCAVMDFHADFFGIESANEFFEETPMKSSVLWNKVVTLNVEYGEWLNALQCFQKMQTLSIKADEVTIAKALHACGRLRTLKEGRALHGYAIRSGYSSALLVGNVLIAMYSHNASAELARRVFQSMESRNLVSWNSIISGFALNGFLDDAFELFNEMISSGLQPDLVSWNCLLSGHSLHGSTDKAMNILRRMLVMDLKPNSSSISSVLRAVSDSGLLDVGKQIHGYVMRHGLTSNVYVGTSLIDMYVKCCRLGDARRVFDLMKHRNVYAWNSLISGFAHGGFIDESLELLKQMEREGVQPDLTTWNGLIDGYTIKGMSKQASRLIHQLKTIGIRPNVVSWTSIISGCCQNAHYEDSLYYFKEMQNDGIEPNSVTLASILRACAALAFLKKGTELHCFALRKGINCDTFVTTGLIDMYCKSGSLVAAQRVFENMSNKTLASWNAMIMGFAAHGLWKEATSLFDKMCEAGVEPDGISFTAVLSACRHSGLTSEGWKYFDNMRNTYNVIPTVEHYACMVDHLARGGYLDEAWDFIRDMPLEPDASVWGALLGACRNHRNVEIAEIAAKHLFKLEPYNPANYLLMMSIYAYENRWRDVEIMRDAMNAAGVKSRAGWSWIQIGQSVHVFQVEGKLHPEISEIYFELYQLASEMKSLGYVPDISCIIHNVDETEKEKLLMSHTEKLAITYGLINTERDTTIRVITNTRVCNDCHSIAKFISKLRARKILLRDGARYHCFKDGNCSCNDYW